MKSKLQNNKGIYERSCLNCINFCLVSENRKNATYACFSKQVKQVYKEFEKERYQETYGRILSPEFSKVAFSYIDEPNAALDVNIALNICRQNTDNFVFWKESKTKKIRVHDDECNFIGVLELKDVIKSKPNGGGNL